MDESMTQTDPFTWFRSCQVETVIRNGVVPQWFHGMISRKASEELLMCKPPGYFLIRVSESRIGYTLSYRAEDRCKHFMIDVLKDGYIIVGDDRHHRFLEDLVDFHRQFPINPFSELLTMPCGQISDVNTDYEELLLPKMNSPPDSPLLQVQENVPVPAVAPALPYRPGSLMDSAAQPFTIQSSRLYPSLDHLQNEFPWLDLQQAGPTFTAPNTVNTPITPMPSKPPELPSRNVNPISKKNQSGTQTSSASPSPTKNHKEPMDSLTSVMSNLKKFKKKLINKSSTSDPHSKSSSSELRKSNSFDLHTKSNSSELLRKSNSAEQAVYEEVAEVKSEPEYQAITDHQMSQDEQTPHSLLSSAELPQEYLAPPPFAPGYT